MQLTATDKQNNIHHGKNIKSLIVREENGNPLAIIKETIIGDLNNYRILTPVDKEFNNVIRALGFTSEVIALN